VRHAGRQRAFTLRPNALSRDDLRRIGYHLRVHRGVAMFARAWLLVEGESEYWILPQVARVLGHDLALEGVCCVSFAQCGIEPLIRAAHELGIEWHLLADGDDAGERYVAAARKLLGKSRERERITLLGERDIEHFFWRHGHSEAIARAAGLPEGARIHSPSRVIAKAVERHSKPHLALRLVEAVAERGARGVPAALAQLVQTCVELARRAPQRALEEPAAKRRSPSART
jgi:putative ATP-dependent endonuclease of OLD family